MATSVVARGKIAMALKQDRSIPPGWAIDPDGRPTTDPAAALAGAVLPVAGYKGAGLALVIDALCGILTGAASGPAIGDLYADGDRAQNVGHLFLAIDVAFMPQDHFEGMMDRFARDVRAQPRLPGVDGIRLPGELEFGAAERSARLGVPLPAVGIDELDGLAREVGVAPLSARSLRLRATEPHEAADSAAWAPSGGVDVPATPKR